jgi:hypothetical protein
MNFAMMASFFPLYAADAGMTATQVCSRALCMAEPFRHPSVYFRLVIHWFSMHLFF